MSNCQICDYNINKSIRRAISCPYCNFEACKTCCEKYILGESTVKCMNTSCGREWTRQYIKTVFPNSFINGKLKEHREALLFDIERSLLPSTQPLVEKQIKGENLDAEYKETKQKLRELSVKCYQLQTDIYNLKNNNKPTERAEFIKSCPDSNCRGFLSSQWKCGICEKWACPSCHEIKGTNRDTAHECNPDTVATISLLSNDTKPCPNCRTGIFKVEGCNQMFCTSCNTAFDWRTGRIENRAIHNPHYFEWLRRTGGQIPENQPNMECRNELTHRSYQEIREIFTLRHPAHPLSKVCDTYMSKLIRNILHIRYTILPSHEERDWTRRNELLRISYMRKRITEEQFKVMLQRDQKKAEKSREIRNVLDILLGTVTDIIYRFKHHLKNVTKNAWDLSILEEIDPIVDYANTCFQDISKTYNSKLIIFSNELSSK